MSPIASFLGAGGDVFARSFSDSLTVVDPISPVSIGPNWIQGSWVLDGNINSAATAYLGIGASSIDAINCFQWHTGGPAAAGVGYESFALPVPTLNAAITGKTQFAQATFIQGTGTARGGGLGCNIYPADTNPTQYAWYIIGNGSWSLQQWKDGAASVLTSAVAGSIVNGDVLRMSTDQSVAGQVTIRLTRNGTLNTTFVDNTAGRLVGIGWPGLVATGVTSADKSEWRTFSCGLGL